VGSLKKDNLPNEMYADIGKAPTERKYDVLYLSYTEKRFFLNSSDIDY
jgi:hypothetical protein